MGREPITIKKTKLVLKAPVAEPATDEAPAEGAGATAPAADAVAATPVKTGPGAFQIITFILVLLSFGIFTALVIIQYLEWSYYHQPPTAFPEFVPNYNVLPSVSTTPKPQAPSEAALPETVTPAPLAAAPAPAAASPTVSNTTPTSTTEPPPKPRPTRPPRPADMPEGV